ncbi:MAG: hypothetical protein ACK5IJ_06190 [Mangrovibacterium sp.]
MRRYKSRLKVLEFIQKKSEILHSNPTNEQKGNPLKDALHALTA